MSARRKNSQAMADAFDELSYRFAELEALNLAMEYLIQCASERGVKQAIENLTRVGRRLAGQSSSMASEAAVGKFDAVERLE